MGAWGHGLLQNDYSQDGLCEVHNGIEADITKLARRKPSEDLAGRLAAGVGLLLHLNSHYSFNSENTFLDNLNASLTRQEPAFDALPRRAATLLRDLRAHPEKGYELVARTGPLDRQLQYAFFARGRGFPMERRMGKREPALFEHPASAEYVQTMASRCLRVASVAFRKRSLAQDLSGWRRAGSSIACLAALLVIEPCQVKAEYFRDCWDLYRAANVGLVNDEDEEFHRAYRACLRTAMEVGLRKFSSGSEPKPLED